MVEKKEEERREKRVRWSARQECAAGEEINR